MTDRETLVAVAKGYHDIMALQDQQRATTAKMIRACVARARSPEILKRQEGLKGLLDLADMLDKPATEKKD